MRGAGKAGSGRSGRSSDMFVMKQGAGTDFAAQLDEVVANENAAVCALLQMAVAEFAEITSSLWVLVVVPLLWALDTGFLANSQLFPHPEHGAAVMGGYVGGDAAAAAAASNATATAGRAVVTADAVRQACLYSAVDAGIEVASFLAMSYVVREFTGMHVLPALVAYVDQVKLRWTMVATGFMVIIIGFNQFLDHAGVTDAMNRLLFGSQP